MRKTEAAGGWGMKDKGGRSKGDAGEWSTQVQGGARQEEYEEKRKKDRTAINQNRQNEEEIRRGREGCKSVWTMDENDEERAR